MAVPQQIRGDLLDPQVAFRLHNTCSTSSMEMSLQAWYVQQGFHEQTGFHTRDLVTLTLDICYMSTVRP